MAATQVVKTAAGTAISVNGVTIDPTGATPGQVLTLAGGKFVPGAGGGASLGNWTFSGNVADLTGAGAITVGGATATSISLAKAAISLAANVVLTGASSATNTVGASLVPNVADGASSVAFDVNNATTLANAAASLFRLRNNGTVRLTTVLNSIDGVVFVDGGGTSKLALSTNVGSVLSYGTASLSAGSGSVSVGDGTGVISMSGGNATFTILQGVPDADGTRDWGLVGTRWRVLAAKRIVQNTQSLAHSATPAFDATAGNIIHIGPVTANVTAPTMVAGSAGEKCTVIFLKDATAGTYTIATNWGANVRMSATAIAFAATASQVITINFFWDDRLSTPAWVERCRSGPI